MMMKRILLLSFFGLTLYCSSAQVESLFQQANEAYSEKAYAKAIELYGQLVEQDYQSVELYYNLGNSYFKQQELGRAILFFEKALLLDPDDEDARHNLQLARSLTKDDIAVLPPFFLARWWGGIRQLNSGLGWALVSILVLWLGIAGLVIWLVARERQRKKLGFILGGVLILLSVFFLALARSQSQIEDHNNMAIVLAKETSLKSAPDEESTELLLLHEGAKVELLDQIGSWSKVRLMNGEQGWLPFATFERI